MTLLSNIFLTLHIVLLLGFVSVTAALLAVTVINRLRVKKVLLSWYDRRSRIVFLWPVAFILLVISFFCYSLFIGNNTHPLFLAGYFVGSTLWIVSVRLSTATIVNTCGLICNINRTPHSFAWGQVEDYFEREEKNSLIFVFLYVNDIGRRCRCELIVPSILREQFYQIIEDKLSTRFENTKQQACGKKALEG